MCLHLGSIDYFTKRFKFYIEYYLQRARFARYFFYRILYDMYHIKNKKNRLGIISVLMYGFMYVRVYIYKLMYGVCVVGLPKRVRGRMHTRSIEKSKMSVRAVGTRVPKMVYSIISERIYT